jgi:hypothetical protein
MLPPTFERAKWSFSFLSKYDPQKEGGKRNTCFSLKNL